MGVSRTEKWIKGEEVIKEVRGLERWIAMKFRSPLPVSVHEVCGKVSSLMALQQFAWLYHARGLMPG